MLQLYLDPQVRREEGPDELILCQLTLHSGWHVCIRPPRQALHVVSQRPQRLPRLPTAVIYFIPEQLKANCSALVSIDHPPACASRSNWAWKASQSDLPEYLGVFTDAVAATGCWAPPFWRGMSMARNAAEEGVIPASLAILTADSLRRSITSHALLNSLLMSFDHPHAPSSSPSLFSCFTPILLNSSISASSPANSVTQLRAPVRIDVLRSKKVTSDTNVAFDKGSRK